MSQPRDSECCEKGRHQGRKQEGVLILTNPPIFRLGLHVILVPKFLDEGPNMVRCPNLYKQSNSQRLELRTNVDKPSTRGGIIASKHPQLTLEADFRLRPAIDSNKTRY